MCAKGKGILAADESTGTMDKRLSSVGVECTDKNRLNFRETLFTSDAMKSYIGGVILFDVTIREKISTGVSVPELLKENNSLANRFKKDLVDWFNFCKLKSIHPVKACLDFCKSIKEIDFLIIGVQDVEELKQIIKYFNQPKKINSNLIIKKKYKKIDLRKI